MFRLQMSCITQSWKICFYSRMDYCGLTDICNIWHRIVQTFIPFTDYGCIFEKKQITKQELSIIFESTSYESIGFIFDWCCAGIWRHIASSKCNITLIFQFRRNLYLLQCMFTFANTSWHFKKGGLPRVRLISDPLPCFLMPTANLHKYEKILTRARVSSFKVNQQITQALLIKVSQIQKSVWILLTFLEEVEKIEFSCTFVFNPIPSRQE